MESESARKPIHEKRFCWFDKSKYDNPEHPKYNVLMFDGNIKTVTHYSYDKNDPSATGDFLGEFNIIIVNTDPHNIGYGKTYCVSALHHMKKPMLVVIKK